MTDVGVHKLNTTVSGSTKSLTNTDLSSLEKDFYFFKKRNIYIFVCKYLMNKYFATLLVKLPRLKNPGQEKEGEATLPLHFLSRHNELSAFTC